MPPNSNISEPVNLVFRLMAGNPAGFVADHLNLFNFKRFAIEPLDGCSTFNTLVDVANAADDVIVATHGRCGMELCGGKDGP